LRISALMRFWESFAAQVRQALLDGLHAGAVATRVFGRAHRHGGAHHPATHCAQRGRSTAGTVV